MNPYQLLRRTPGSNCGQCGWPTCLAFAAAVTKAGARADLCPHLQREGLPAELLGGSANVAPDALDRSEEERHTALAAYLRGKMRGLDFRSLAPRLGADWSAEEPDMLRFTFLGRPVRLGAAGVFINGEPPPDPRDQILLYNYVASGGGRKPDGTWVGMESLPNSIAKIRTLAVYCEQRLAERFRSRASQLAALCRRIGAAAGPADQGADLALILPTLPCLPFFLLFWDESPDDGFEARVKILFDHQVMDFLDLESLVFAAERAADWLLELDC